ncbi:P-loop containing nucleoside triphosphate hydrolase protein, partial [Zopfochytrium polystomum]
SPATSFTAFRRAVSWHPGHQKQALRRLRDGLHQVDLIVEVRDARIPLSSANRQFEEVLGRRDRIIVMNKADLANRNMSEVRLQECDPYRNSDPVLFTSTLSPSSLQPIIELAKEKIRRDPFKYPFLSMVLVGLPNVGKSSLINHLRHIGVKKGKAAPVAPHAGVTQSIQTRVKILENPPIYLVDTPGILDPSTKSILESIRIALVGCSKDSLMDEEEIVRYLLFRLNQS